MRVIIVSDSSLQKQLELFLKNFEKINKIKFNISFLDTEKNLVLENIIHDMKTEDLNIAILCHSIKNPLAFELAVKIKTNNPKCEIIFISSSAEYAIEGYKIDLSYYILQPFDFDEFSFAVEKCLKNLNMDLKYILVSSNWQKINIKLDSIQFAEKIGHNVMIHTEKQTISTRTTFTEFLQNFKNSSQFINCVRGALVNLNWVEKLEPQNFLMKTGNRISIRRKDRKKIKQLYNEFLLNKNDNSE